MFIHFLLFHLIFELKQGQIGNMDLKKLLDLDKTNKTAACAAFRSSYGDTPIMYRDSFYYAKKDDGYTFNPNNSTLVIEDLKFWKLFLRSFGHLLKDIQVCVDQLSHSISWSMVDEIFIYCTTLKKLQLYCDTDDESDWPAKSKLWKMSRNPLRLNKVCLTLECLDVQHIFLQTPLDCSRIGELFPNLRSLDLNSISVSYSSFIETNFPKLQHIGITLDDDDDDDYDDGHSKSIGSYLSVDNVKTVFALNPQLQSIYLNIPDIDMALVEFINDILPDLKTVDFDFIPFDAMNSRNRDGVITFKNVCKANLGRLGEKKIPIEFKQLKCLNFNTAAHRATIEFIKKQTQLTTLSVICEYTDKQVLEVVKALPQLKDLDLIVENHKKWSANGLVRLLAMCERLDKVVLMIDVNSKNHHNWRSYVSNVYEISNDSGDFHMIKKG